MIDHYENLDEDELLAEDEAARDADKKSVMVPKCQIQMRWLTAEEGGRTTPYRGVRHTPTARFAGEQDRFSVVLDFAEGNAANPTKGTLRLLFSDLHEIQRRIDPGVTMEIMEGARVVAHCVVESLDGAAISDGAPMTARKYPPEWDEARVKRLIDHYENMGDDELLAEDEAVRGRRPTWKSTGALVSLVLCVLSWELCAAVLVGCWLFGAGWFGPQRSWAVFGVTAALSVFHSFWGRRWLQKNYRPGDPSQRSLTGGQVVAVTVVVIGAGAFGTWLFCRGPGQ